MKKISIIVPVFNTGKYLKKCIDSLVNQSLKEIEIIIVDDGSEENIKEIIKEYKDKIIYIKSPHKGIGYTRNTGIKKATGEYIGFVDSDDYVNKNMYESYYKYAIENDLDLVVGNYNKVFKDNTTILNVPYFDISNIKDNPSIITNIDYGPCNKLFKRDIIIKNNIYFEEELKYEDMPFISKFLYNSKSIGHINEAHYNYVVRDKSETTSFNERNFDIFKIMDIFNNTFNGKYKEEVEYIVVSKLLDYNIQQRTNKDQTFKNRFINTSFEYINNNYPKYKNNKYLKKENILKRIIKQNKLITILYCYLYKYIK